MSSSPSAFRCVIYAEECHLLAACERVTRYALQRTYSSSPARLRRSLPREKDAGTEVVEAKAGGGSATLSMAYAAARFCSSCLDGLAGIERVVECAYIENTIPGDASLPFFSSPVVLGPDGVKDILPLGTLSAYEQQCLEELKSELAGSIKKGIDFAANN